MDTALDQYRQACITSLQSQSLECKSLQSGHNAALFTLYYAQGAELSKERQLGTIQEQLQYLRALGDQCTTAATAIDLLRQSIKGAASYVEQSVSNNNMAAANVLAPAQTLAKLARVFAGSLSIGVLPEWNEQLSALMGQINASLQSLSASAVDISQAATEISAVASEVNLPAILPDVDTVGQTVSTLSASVSAELTLVSQLNSAQSEALAGLLKDRRTAENSASNAGVALQAAHDAITVTNSVLNSDLSVQPMKGMTSRINFRSTGIDAYTLLVVKEAKQLVFGLSDALKSGNGFQVKSGYTADLSNVRDSDGEPVVLGVNYVSFLLATSSSVSVLSAQSPVFCLTSRLQAAQDLAGETAADGRQILTFRAISADVHAGYRCFFLPVKGPAAGPDFVFDLALALQVSAADYTIARQGTGVIGPDTTDIFGESLAEGAWYLPAVLSIADVNSTDFEKYGSALSDLPTSKPFQFKFTNAAPSIEAGISKGEVIDSSVPEIQPATVDRAFLERLTRQVVNAQARVIESEAIFMALSDKSSSLQGLSGEAEKEQQNFGEWLAVMGNANQQAEKIQDSLQSASVKIERANGQSRRLSSNVATLTSRLIDVVGLHSRFSAMLSEQSATQPPATDEPAKLCGTAIEEANKAVAAQLVAVRSILAAMSSNTSSQAMCVLLLSQCRVVTNQLLADVLKQIARGAAVVSPKRERLARACEITSERVSDAAAQVDRNKAILANLQARLADANGAAGTASGR